METPKKSESKNQSEIDSAKKTEDLVETLDLNEKEEKQLLAVEKSWEMIKYIENPSEKVQLVAVEQNWFAIEYIENPSEEVQLAAAEISLAYGYDHPATFYNKRYKIRKKMNLPASTDLEEYLRELIIEAEQSEKEAIRQGIETKSLDSVLNNLSLQ